MGQDNSKNCLWFSFLSGRIHLMLDKENLIKTQFFSLLFLLWNTETGTHCQRNDADETSWHCFDTKVNFLLLQSWSCVGTRGVFFSRCRAALGSAGGRKAQHQQLSLPSCTAAVWGEPPTVLHFNNKSEFSSRAVQLQRLNTKGASASFLSC